MTLAMIVRFSPDPWLAEPPDPDSILRLVQVRDFLAGQAWGDLVQARLGGEGGLAMHWSRLVDAPIAVLIAVGGERFAMFAWPLLLFLGLIMAAVLAARRLGGPAAVLPAAVVTAVNISLVTYFIPGRFDHHNVQLVLLLVLVGAMMRFGESRFAAGLAGFVMALMLAVGMESLPFVAVAGAVLALTWAFAPSLNVTESTDGGPAGPSDAGGGLAVFAIVFMLGLLALYPVVVPDGGAHYCDAFSAAYLTAGLVGGAGIAALSLLARGAGVPVRLAGLAAVGCAALAATAVLHPACLAGPMGNVSDELKSEWMSTVAEAQPLWTFAAVLPEKAFAAFAAPVLATIFACRKALDPSAGPARRHWIMLAALLLVALAYSIYQYRATPFLNALSIPVLAVWIAEWSRHVDNLFRENGRAIAFCLVWLSALQASYLTLANVTARAVALVMPAPAALEAADAPAMMVARADATKAEQECVDPASAAALAALPPGRVLSPLFYGPTVLALSGHAALAGPYHRAEGPILDNVRAGAGDDATARAVMRRRGIDYIVICPTSREVLQMVLEQASGFFPRLMTGRHPAWLQPVETDGSYLRIYRVTVASEPN